MGGQPYGFHLDARPAAKPKVLGGHHRGHLHVRRVRNPSVTTTLGASLCALLEEVRRSFW